MAALSGKVFSERRQRFTISASSTTAGLHSIKIERVFGTEPGSQYPRLIEAVGFCPPLKIAGDLGVSPTSLRRSPIRNMSGAPT